MDVVIGTDILSTFCKIDKLELLARLFRKTTIIISPSVSKEIRRAIRDGKLEYKSPPNFATVKLTPSERMLAKEFLNQKRLGIGDCECLAIARYRKCLLLTNDKQVQRMAEYYTVDYINLFLILRELYVTGRSSKQQVYELVTQIERNDKVRIRGSDTLLNS